MDHRYDSHRTAALEAMESAYAKATGQVRMDPAQASTDVMLKVAHVEAMVYVGDQINRLCEVAERRRRATSPTT